MLGRHPKADGIRSQEVGLIAESEPPTSERHGLFLRMSIDPVAGKATATLPPAGVLLAGSASSRRGIIAGSAISLVELLPPLR